MFISWRNFHAASGPVENQFDYRCGHCGTQAHSVVRSTGRFTSTAVNGSGGSAEAARIGAVQAAYANAYRAMQHVACPKCNKLQPQLLEQFETLRTKADAQQKRRWPTAGIAAGIAFAVGAVPAIIDLRTSPAAAFGVLFLALAIGAIALIRYSSLAPPLEIFRDAEVWFWWHPHPYQPTWTQAVPSQVLPVPVSTSRGIHRFAWGALLAALTGVIVAGVFWRETFLDLYVVDVRRAGDLSVIVDGKSEGTIVAHVGQDVPFASFSVRRGKSHEIVLTRPTGTRESFTLDEGQPGQKGWVIAPEASQNDLCLLDDEVIYSARYASETIAAPKLLNTREGASVMRAMHRFDYEFESGPSTIQLQNGSTEERKRLLRGYVCSALEFDKLVPYAQHVPSHPR